MSFVKAAYSGAEELVRQCERRGLPWGEYGMMSDITLAYLLKRCWIEWRYVDQLDREGKILEAVFPPVLGIHVMLLAKGQEPGARRFAIRHGLAHVLAGHNLVGRTGDGGWEDFEETVADLFALLDIIPDCRLEELRSAGYSGSELEHWVYSEIASWTSGWPPERIADRAALRLMGGGGAQED